MLSDGRVNLTGSFQYLSNSTNLVGFPEYAGFGLSLNEFLDFFFQVPSAQYLKFFWV